MIVERTGNIFKSECQTIVNTINCFGVMGAGIAFEFRLRHPEMYEKYKKLCEQKKIQIGTLWIYTVNPNQKILNFPTKDDWKKPTNINYLEKGLEKFINTYSSKNITSIAFPLLGASHGGLSPDVSLTIMKYFLVKCDIPIEIWTYDSSASDDLFESFKVRFQSNDFSLLSKQTSITPSMLAKIENGLKEKRIRTISGLLNLQGIGEKTVERIFQYMHSEPVTEQRTLFE